MTVVNRIALEKPAEPRAERGATAKGRNGYFDAAALEVTNYGDGITLFICSHVNKVPAFVRMSPEEALRLAEVLELRANNSPAP